jgi:Ca-activated chloride channel family protein
LLHPAAADLRIEFAGGDVYDVQPGNLPNLYHGSPIRLYARYRSPGKVTAAVRAKVAGQDVEQSFPLVLPETDAANPEVERMWAARKVDALLKRIDAGDDKDAVAEVVRLGEAFSIATPYTSFIVLENDAEYQRWKIQQANVLRTARDRQSNERRLKEFEAIRSKAAANIGPPADALDKPPTAVSAAPTPAPSQPPTGWRPSGGGPVDPLTVAVVGLLAAAGTWRGLRRRGPRL